MRKIDWKRCGGFVPTGAIGDAKRLLDLYESRGRIYRELQRLSSAPNPFPAYKEIGVLLEDMRRYGFSGQGAMKGDIPETCSKCGGDLICPSCDGDSVDEMAQERAAEAHEARMEARD